MKGGQVSVQSECAVCSEYFTESGKPHFEVIIPLYHSEKHIQKVFAYINQISKAIPGGLAATFVADGRLEDYVEVSDQINSFQLPYKVILLSRNFGVGPALHAALADSDYCASAAFGSDLQEPEELFIEFFTILAAGKADLVLGYRTKRADPILSKYLAKFYWWVNKTFIHQNSPASGFDVFAMNRDVRKSFIKLCELNTNFTSQLLWVGFNPKWIGFERKSREIGKSTWSYRRKLKLFADSLYGYSSKPITLITVLGFLSSFAFFLIGILTLVGKFTKQIVVPGYVMTIVLIAFGQSLLLFSMGIIGGYASRGFENSTGRPNYIVARKFTSE